MNRTNAILLAVVAIVGAFVWIAERPGRDAPEGYVERKPLIESFDASTV